MMGYYMSKQMSRYVRMRKMNNIYKAEKEYELALGYYDHHKGDRAALEACYRAGNKYYHMDAEGMKKMNELHKDDEDDLLDFYLGPHEDEEMMIKEKIFHDIKGHEKQLTCDYPLSRVH